MNTLEGLPLHSYYKNLQATEKKKYAWKILHEFFEAFDEEGAQETLWFMLSAAMKLESEEVDGKERSNMLFFYDYSMAFYKAVHFLYQEYHQRKGDPVEDIS
ncbi:hypothetical protein LZZ85_06700 [Terrimonas sp. NA20]|uniref:Uncharacterized protein n=1 Tax=Terrimonas ginsenosidimutans TaxID=2908004 RepID=A0ABS9KNS7_9BACT|nr:hypothetical protein [Terrimonas ginsenosidimutans]MCG2613961.1 hypothetical protein [Terrimonas ginsenosidimutans]